MAADGSIIIDTKIDTGGISSGVKEVQAAFKDLANSVKEINANINSVFHDGLEKLEDSFQSLQQKSEKVENSMDKMGNSAKKPVAAVSNSFNKIGNSAKKTVAAVSNSFNKMDISGASRKVNLLGRQFEGLGTIVKRIGFLVGSAFAVGKLIQFGKESIELGSDLAEVQNVVDVTFTTMSDKVNEFAKNAMTSAGLSETMAKRYVGTFGAMSKSFGFSEAQAYDMSTALTQLTGDVASFYNISQDLAYTKLKSVFTGETETLKDLGVVLTQNALDQYALANGYGKTTSEMTEQEKVALRLAFVQKQLSAASGDFIRTSDSWANQVRVMQLQLQSLKATVGQGLINIFTPVLKVINVLLGKLATLANAFKSFTELITGKKSSGQTGASGAGLAGTDAIADTADQYGDAADNAEKLADATNDTADATKKATKAAKGYLSTIDEINNYSTDKSADSSSKVPGVPGVTGGLADQMKDAVQNVDYGKVAEGETVLDKISKSVKKLAKLIKKEDWEGLGAYIASGINKGLQKIYDVINWNNVGPKITKFCDAFTRTFNSLVDHIDWDLLGRTVGAGINTLVNTMNLLITGINWKNLGKKFAEGITGLVREVNWNNLGQLLGNMFMISWKIFSGFVHNLPYADIGKAVADALNGVFSTVSFSEIGDALATGLNGAFTTLYNFAVNFNWKQMVDNIASGINTFVSKFDWKGNGQKLEIFLNNLCTSLVELAQKTNWEEVGKGIGTFLSQINWSKHLWQVIEAIKTMIGGLFDGLEESGTAGKIAAFLGKAFIAVKIANITGIGSLVKLLIGEIGKKIIGSEAVATLSGNLTSVLGKAASAAAGGFNSLASSLAPLVGTAGLIAAVATAAIVGTEKLAGFIETLQGGNGVLTQAGGYLHDYAGAMSSSNVITQKQAEDLWKLIEADESAGKSNAEMYDSFIHKLSEYGISAEQARAILEQYGAQAGVTGTFVEDMTNKVMALGQGFSESAGQIDLSSLSAKEAISVLSDTLYTLSLKGDEFSGTYQGVRSQLQDTGGSAKSAQDALNMVYTALKNAGVPLDDLNAALGAEFPAATTAVTTAVDTNIVGAQEKISSSIKTAQTDVEEATAGIKSSTEENFAGVNDSTVLNWGNSAKEVKTNVRAMKIQANLSLGEMTKGVKSQFQSQYNIMTKKWENASDEINRTVVGMSGSIDRSLSSLVGKVESYGSRMESSLSGAISRAADRISTTLNNIISKVNGMINNINSAISGIERGFTFSYNVQLPNGGRRWGNYHLTLPRVNTVPYLASGAVIPPRSEFLAVLGDQKKGNNLEAPESLLRQIVREESGKWRGDGNTYNVTVNASGRKLLDIIISEAEMRRNRNGKNPFELA